jgi:diguanylate cyclase (GGDEF)-like protein
MRLKLNPKTFLFAIALFVTYVIAGKLALKLAFLHPSATPVWPCTGIALAALLLLGYRFAPVIFAAAFVVNITTAGTVLTSLAIATGNTLEALAGAYLVLRFAGGRNAFQTSRNIFGFTLFAGMVATAISASMGTATLVLGGLANASRFPSIWATWWLGDGVGALILTPLILLWIENPRFNWTRQQVLELTALFLGLFATGLAVFGDAFSPIIKNYPFEYLCFPFLIWAAFRFGRRKAATAISVLSLVATWGTVHGFGPFARPSQNTSLLLLQSFMATVSLTIMVLAAESTEHSRAQEHVQRLAGSDPLTGLANYRRIVETIDTEIKRYGRTCKPFSLALFDLDQLKKINDTHGHLVGSRALCRLAEIIHLHSREIDLAARYGGDEFVLILPETNAEAARHVANRISTRLRSDSEMPPLSVSSGVAAYPDDGQTLDELLQTADRDLYREKSAPRAKFHLPL